jgi:hypothetical protein
MLSQETANVSPTEVTPRLGEGTLDTWRLHAVAVALDFEPGTITANDGTRQ